MTRSLGQYRGPVVSDQPSCSSLKFPPRLRVGRGRHAPLCICQIDYLCLHFWKDGSFTDYRSTVQPGKRWSVSAIPMSSHDVLVLQYCQLEVGMQALKVLRPGALVLKRPIQKPRQATAFHGSPRCRVVRVGQYSDNRVHL